MTERTLLRVGFYPEDIPHLTRLRREWIRNNKIRKFPERSNRAFFHDILLKKFQPVCRLPEEQKRYDFHRCRELKYLYFESTEELHADFLRLAEKYDSLYETHNITVFFRAAFLGIIDLTRPPQEQTPYVKPQIILPKRPVGRPRLTDEERAKRAALPKRPVGRPRLSNEELEKRRLLEEKKREEKKAARERKKQAALSQKTSSNQTVTPVKKSVKKGASSKSVAKKKKRL